MNFLARMQEKAFWQQTETKDKNDTSGRIGRYRGFNGSG